MGDGIWEGGLEDGDGFDFHARAFRQGGDGDTGTGRGIGSEGFAVHTVHSLKISHIHDEYGHFGHIRGRGSPYFLMPSGVSLSGNALTGYQRNIGRHQRRKAEAATVD